MHLWRFDWDPAIRALAEAEARALGATERVAPGLFLASRPFEPGRAGFGIEGGELLGQGPPEALPPQPADARVHVVKGTFKPSGNPVDFLAQLPGEARIGPRRAALRLFCTEGDWFLIRAAPGEAYAAPALPHRTSTSLSSQLGRALVNLVARPGERCLDPVCGTGVALVEAARLGCRIAGSDLSWKAIGWARENLAALGIELRGHAEPPPAQGSSQPPSSLTPELLQGLVRRRDALSLERAAPLPEALVGDLPYGRRLETFDLAPFAARLPTLARRWALVAHEDLRPALTAAGHDPHTTIEVPKPTFVRFVHLGGEAL